MKAKRHRSRGALARIGVSSTLFVLSGASAIWAGADTYALEPGSVALRHDDSVNLEDEFQQESPLIELDPERKYRSEALLSYKSSLAPYGKIVGIRTGTSGTFTPVRTWKDVEDFIGSVSEDRVVVKLLEPWGQEVVASVTVNRKSYPASRVRPAEDPPAVTVKTEPSKPTTKPEPAESKVVILTNVPAKPELAVSNPKAEPVTSRAKTARNTIGEGGMVQQGPQLIEPSSARPMLARASATIADPAARAVSTKPAYAKASAVPGTAVAGPRLMEPRAGLSTSRPVAAVPTSRPTLALRGPAATAATSKAPRIIEPRTVATVSAFEPYSIALLASIPFGPTRNAVTTTSAEVHVYSPTPPVASTPRTLSASSRPASRPSVEDDGEWLRESVDLADKLGILGCKPVISADRRQRAFAIYTLYMGLKDYRLEVDVRAARLNRALERLEARPDSESALEEVVALGRSYERAVHTIMKWNVEGMVEVVKGYTAELRAMDDVRSMLSLLDRIKDRPKIHANLRSISGLEEEEE